MERERVCRHDDSEKKLFEVIKKMTERKKLYDLAVKQYPDIGVEDS